MEGSVQRLKALLRADIRKRITGMSSQQKQRECEYFFYFNRTTVLIALIFFR